MKQLILWALLVVSGASFAQTAPGTTPAPATTPAASAAKPAVNDDDEEDPGPAKAVDAPTPAGDAAKVAPATGQAPKADAAADVSNPDEQTLVNGAPLKNPNVAVHIVEKKSLSDQTKWEISLFPAAFQMNGKFTQYWGTAAAVTWHFHENFAFQVSGQYNWFSVQSAFNDELIDKVQVEAETASSLLWQWGAIGGVEVKPFYGKFAIYGGTLAHFSFVLNGGLGIGGTRHQLKPANSSGPATYGQTGLKFLSELGAGFRLQIGDMFAVRLEMRDIVYTARVDGVNGCSAGELNALYQSDKAGTLKNANSVTVGSACNVGTFFDKDNKPVSTDIKYARDLTATASSDVLNNLGVYAGFSVLF